MIDASEQKLREQACEELRVKVSDIFKRGKPSEMRRRVEKRIEQLRLVNTPLNFDSYAATVVIPDEVTKPKRGRPRKNPAIGATFDSFLAEEGIKEEIHETVEKRVNADEKEKVHYSRVANPNPPPLHKIDDLRSFKFSVKNDVPKFLKKKA